jgi:Domain of unknown function (DUF4440)
LILKALNTARAFGFLLMACASPAFADPASEAMSATRDLYVQLSTPNPEAFARYVPALGFTEYNADRASVTVMTMAYFTAVMTSGVKLDLKAVDLKAQAFGDVVVVTGYRSGTITPPGAAPIASRQQMSFVWSKEQGQWQVRHVHLSPAPVGP